MESYTIIVLIFGIICLLILIAIFYVNRLINYKKRVEKSLKTVTVHIKKRKELLKEIEYFIEKNLKYEKSYLIKLKNIDKYISIFLTNYSFKDFKKYEKEFLSFTSLEDTYKNLNKDKEYLKLKEEIIVNQDNLIYALDSYDKGVINYNNYRLGKIVSIISKIFRFPDYDYYNKEI